MTRYHHGDGDEPLPVSDEVRRTSRVIPHDGYQTSNVYGYVFVVGPTPADGSDRFIVVTDARTGDRVDGLAFRSDLDPSDQMAAWLVSQPIL